MSIEQLLFMILTALIGIAAIMLFGIYNKQLAARQRRSEEMKDMELISKIVKQKNGRH